MSPITLLTAPPIFMPIDKFDEFQASTPASGTFDHEPVLHHHEKNATIALDPAIPGFDLSQNTKGDIYVTEAALSFYNPETQAGFSVPYPVITLHATSRGTPPGAPEGANHPCVYCQLDETDPSEWDNLPEDELPETKELYIYTQQDSAVLEIYAALSRCATLHPSTEEENAPAWDLGSLITGNQEGRIAGEEGESDPLAAQDLQAQGQNGDVSAEGGRTQTQAQTQAQAQAQLERLEGLIDWNGFQPVVNGSASGNANGIAATTGRHEEDNFADAPDDDEDK